MNRSMKPLTTFIAIAGVAIGAIFNILIGAVLIIVAIIMHFTVDVSKK